MDIETIIKYLNAFILISITILGTYIAYQQWITNERKRKQDLFELRRKYIYSKSLELLHNIPNVAKSILNDNLSEDSIFIKYAKYHNEYGFLLKTKDSQCLENFYKEAIKVICKIVSDSIDNYDKNIKEYEEKTKVLLKDDLNKIMEKYLRIEN